MKYQYFTNTKKCFVKNRSLCVLAHLLQHDAKCLLFCGSNFKKPGSPQLSADTTFHSFWGSGAVEKPGWRGGNQSLCNALPSQLHYKPLGTFSNALPQGAERNLKSRHCLHLRSLTPSAKLKRCRGRKRGQTK